MVLSDGFAYDHNYEGDYAKADARRALAEARRRGTPVSVSASAPGPMQSRFAGSSGPRPTPASSAPTQLTTTAGPLFLSALKLAEVQRRSSQRQQRTRERLEVERRSA